MTWFGLVNPAAGRKGPRAADMVAAGLECGLDALFTETSSAAQAGTVVTKALATGHRKFIAVGGDGTAHLLINTIMDSGLDEKCSLAIIAAGSGSDFVRTFGQSRDLHEALGRIAAPDPDIHTVDVGVAYGSFGHRFFLNALNVGVAAASAAQATRLPRWAGSARYTTAFWLALWRFSEGHVDVRVDHLSLSEDLINVVVANGQFFGGGLNIAPRSVVTDGAMDVLSFRGPKRQAFTVMPRVLMGSHLTHKAVRRFSGSDIHIDAPDSWPVEADGELIGSGGVDIKVIPGAVDFVV